MMLILKKYEEINQKLMKAEGYIEHMKREHNAQMDQLAKRVDRCVYEWECSEGEHARVNSNCKKIADERDELLEENKDLINKLKKVQEEMQEMQAESRGNAKIVEDQTQRFKDFYEMMHRKERECASLAEKIQKLKAQVCALLP
eukprot:TRINITY_DN5143_c0_g1_i11.p3 TRINITY_DN5143_c0_g1~~TRINITY_DN5143_c0_g1_i11.p3  ORF type:complete len:144 (-),score=33.48 TRINITY_DN5143_c0_g1_i11:658-1089(-)